MTVVTDVAGAMLAGATKDASIERLSSDELDRRLYNPLDGAAYQEFARRAAQAVKTVPRDVLRGAGGAIASLTGAVSRIGTHDPFPALELVPVAGPLMQLLQKLATGVDGSAAQGKAPGTPPTAMKVVVADPVDPATGQLSYSHTDLSLAGGGIDFEFTRTYRSQAHYPNGPLGASWDHSLNFYVRQLTPTSWVVGTGSFREDRYDADDPAAPAYFAPRSGYHATLAFASDPAAGESFVLTRPDGLTYHFASTNGAPADIGATLHRITRVIDRFGNQLVYTYVDFASGRLDRIWVNDPSQRQPAEGAAQLARYVAFAYDDLGRITKLTDATGRAVVYTYDDWDDLVAVTLPATRDYPLGRTTFYDYSSAYSLMPHQLLSVVDDDGRRYLDAEYSSDDGFVDYARVSRQRDDEGEWCFDYADVEHVEPADVNTATRYTVMARPSGTRVEMLFNANGNVTERRVTALDEDGVPQTAVTRFWYNADGAVLAQLLPARRPDGLDAVLVEHWFGREEFASSRPAATPTAEQRRAFGNQLMLVRRARASWPPPGASVRQPGDILQRFTYANPYQLLTSEDDPRDPATLTRYLYDPILVQASPVMPLPVALTRIVHPATTSADGTIEPAVAESMIYDTLGRLLAHTDGEGHTTRTVLFGPGDFATSESGSNVTLDGWVKSVTVGDGETGAATTTYERNARGAVLTVIDPRGNTTISVLDARDLPRTLTRVLTPVVSSTTTPAVSYTTCYRYNAEGKIRHTERPTADDAGRPYGDGSEVHHYKYGDTGQLLRESIGGPDARTWLPTRHVYDDEGRRTRAISPMNNVTHFRYDAEKRLTERTRGWGAPEASTSQIKYDLGGRKRAEVDPRGNVTRLDYDAYGRVEQVVQVVDVSDPEHDRRPLSVREGHTRVFVRDALDNITLERFFEWTAPGQYRLLTWSRTIYDERSRVSRVIRALFPGPVAATSLTDFQDAPAGATFVETWLFYDKNGKVRERREGVVTSGPTPFQGSSTVYSYDAAGRIRTSAARLLELRGAVVCKTSTTYDLNGNVVRVDRLDERLDSVGNVLQQAVISKGSEYDAFNRKTADIDALGNRVSYRFDSRDLLLEHRDARGNLTRFDYDRYGRKVRRTELMSAGQPIVVDYTYDDDGNLVRVDRSGGGQSWSAAFAHDALNRKTGAVLAPGTAAERRYATSYDPSDNIQSHTRATGLRDLRTCDALNRLLRIEYDFSTAPGQPVAGSTFEAFAYDGLGRVLSAKTDTTSVDMQVDSLGRVTQEAQTLVSSQAVIAKSYDSLGNVKTLRYPSGRTILATFDSASRLMSLTDIVGSAVGAPTATATPRRILSRDHLGLGVHTELYANGFRSTRTLDATGRTAAVEWTDAGGTLRLGLIQLFDAAGNRAQDWQTGSEASATPSLVYTYDGVNWLSGVATPTGAAPTPALVAPITPSAPQVPPRPLGGQDVVEAALSTPNPAAFVRRYNYDADGNRIAELDAGGPSTLYASDGLDRDRSLAGARLYDADGNTLVAGAVRRFDAHDRLVVGEGGFQALYDALGRRVLVDDGSSRRRIIYDGNSEIASYVASGSGSTVARLETEWVVGTAVDERIELAQGGHTYVVHRDSVGSIRMLTDESGGVAVRLDFDPYGNELLTRDPIGLRYRFMGRELDRALAPRLYHFRARHYDAKYGRFMQRDPAESSPERSAYQAFAGNPLLYGDPMGTNPLAHRGDRWYIPKALPSGQWEVMGVPLDIKDAKEPNDDFDPIRARTTTYFGLAADWLEKANPLAPYGVPSPVEYTLIQPARALDSMVRSIFNAPYHIFHGYHRAQQGEGAYLYGLKTGNRRLAWQGNLEHAKGSFEALGGLLTLASLVMPIAAELRAGAEAEASAASGAVDLVRRFTVNEMPIGVGRIGLIYEGTSGGYALARPLGYLAGFRFGLARANAGEALVLGKYPEYQAGLGPGRFTLDVDPRLWSPAYNAGVIRGVMSANGQIIWASPWTIENLSTGTYGLEVAQVLGPPW